MMWGMLPTGQPSQWWGLRQVSVGRLLVRCRAYSLGDLVVGGGVSKSPEKPIRKQRGDEKQGHGGPKKVVELIKGHSDLK